jgi:multidrug efflux pump subunit AcrA (membrane-fusion protein)
VLVSGEVVEIAEGLRNGGKVASGEAIVLVDRFEYEGQLVRAKAELSEAEARVAETKARIVLEQAAYLRAKEQRDIAERELGRLTTLEGQGAASTALVDASRLRLSSAIASAEIRQNQVKVLEAQLARESASLERLAWNVKKAERDISNTRLLAPFAGTISEPAAEVGRLVNLNDRVATLIDTNQYDVRFTLGDGQYGRLALAAGALIGRGVTVRWKAGDREIGVVGEVERVSPVVAASTGGFDVYAKLKPGEGTSFIRPGAFVIVELEDIAYDGVARVPQSAVHPGSFIYRIDEDERLQPVKVEAVAFEGDDVFVRGAIGDSARVLTTRLPDAGPGLRVNASKAQDRS